MLRFPISIRRPLAVSSLLVASVFLVVACGGPGGDGGDAGGITLSYSGAVSAEVVTLFDGVSLGGWDGDTDWFRVEGEEIVAGSLERELDHNEFLCTESRWSDFELNLQVKLVGEGYRNGGIQFRSERVAGSREVAGYQADAGEGFWGSLYDESRRNVVLAGPDESLRARVAREDSWNDYTIRAQGASVSLFLNGTQTVDYEETEEGLPDDGYVCLQIHSGPPAEARYRNLSIQMLGPGG